MPFFFLNDSQVSVKRLKKQKHSSESGQIERLEKLKMSEKADNDQDKLKLRKNTNVCEGHFCCVIGLNPFKAMTECSLSC